MLYVADLFLIPGSRIGKGTRGFTGNLAKIHRQVALHVTRALKTAPTDTVDTCADIFPFHLLVEKLIYHTASRLTTLPQTHPLEKHITQAAARYIKATGPPSTRSCMPVKSGPPSSSPSALAVRNQVATHASKHAFPHPRRLP